MSPMQCNCYLKFKIIRCLLVQTSLQPSLKWPLRSAKRLIIIIHLSRFNIFKSAPKEQSEVKYLDFVFNQQRPRPSLTKSIEQKYLQTANALRVSRKGNPLILVRFSPGSLRYTYSLCSFLHSVLNLMHD